MDTSLRVEMMHTDKEFPVSPCKECLDLHKKSKILSAIEKEEWELINTSTYSLHKIVRIILCVGCLCIR